MLVWRKGNIEKTVSVCLAVLCTVIMVHKDTNSSYRLVDCIFDLVWFSFLILFGLAFLSSEHLCVFSLHGTLSQKKLVHFCFCQNLVKFPPTLINFGRQMAKWLKFYGV